MLEEEHAVRAQFADLAVKGLVLQPGDFAPVVDGAPRKIRLTREFVLNAYEVLKRDVDAGRVSMRLAHPGLGDFPLKYGRVTAVGIDRDAARVYVTNTTVEPAWDQLLTEEARGMLYEFGFSIDGRLFFKTLPDGTLEATRAASFEGIDIVRSGAFTGRGLLHEVPASVLASLKITTPPGIEGSRRTTTTQENERMSKISTVNDIPEEVRNQLSPEQQSAYLVAYNQAIEDGSAPEEAHQLALKAAGTRTQGEGKPTNDDALKAQVQRLQARATEADKLEEQVKALKVRAKRADDLEAELKSVKAMLGAETDAKEELSSRVLALEEAHKAAVAEKEEMLVREDIKMVLAKGFEPPARKDAVTTIRRKLGHEAFMEFYKNAPIRVLAGEKGGVEQDPPGGEVSLKVQAQNDLRHYGAKGVIEAQLHQRQDEYGAELRRLLKEGA